MKKRGQISLEYMAVVGITTVVTISLLVLSNYYSRQVESTLDTNQIYSITKEIVDNAESVYYFGQPSKTTIKVFIPKGIQDVTVGPKELSFKVKTQSGYSDVFHLSSVTLQGNISTTYGFHYISVEAKEGYVWINGT